MQTAPVILGTLTAPPYTAVTCDSSKAGMLQWTGANFQACDGINWHTFAGSTGEASNPFSFIDQTNVSTSTTIISNAVTLSGFTGLLPGVCNAGCTGIYRNGVWVGVSGNFSAGDTIAIQQTSAATPSTPTTASVRVGGMTSGTWTVMTGAVVGSTPDAFSFTNVTNASLNTAIISNSVQLQGPTGTWTATCGVGCTNIARNGTWLGTTATGFIPGNLISIQQTSAGTVSTSSMAQVTVGSTTSAPWMVTTASATDPCDGTPYPGTVCADGTIYAGITPDGNVKMYTTRCDPGMSWNGSMCTGTRTEMPWNSGSNLDVPNRTRTTGLANTQLLITHGNTLSPPVPYESARYCAGLSLHGRGDWYLPSIEELKLMQLISNNGTAHGFSTGMYWSSSPYYSAGIGLQFSSGNETTSTSWTISYPVRCARK